MYMKIPIQLCGSKMPKRSRTIKNVMPGILIGNLMGWLEKFYMEIHK